MSLPAPGVSVVIPVFNGSRYIRQALESVISQDCSPVEIIVVDDGSSDDSADIAGQFKGVRCFRRPHSGIAAARNFGIRQSSGNLIAFLDADDFWHPGKLRLQVDYLGEHGEVSAVLSRLENFRDGDGADWLPEDAFVQQPEGMSTLVVRRSAFDAAGLFDESYVIGEDIEWLVRARDAGLLITLLPEILAARRIHDANISRREAGLRKKVTARIMKESLDRRRKR